MGEPLDRIRQKIWAECQDAIVELERRKAILAYRKTLPWLQRLELYVIDDIRRFSPFSAFLWRMFLIIPLTYLKKLYDRLRA